MKLKTIAAAICSLMILSACTNTSVNEKRSSSVNPTESAIVSTESTKTEINTESTEDVSSGESDTATSQEQESKDSGLPEIFETPICRSSLLYCVEDDKILYNDSSDLQAAPASITKTLTASVALKYLKPDDVITVGTELSLVNEDSSTCFIQEGHQLTLRDLLTGMLLCSGNDAAYTTAVNTARAVHPEKTLSDEEAVEIFVGMMNETAAEIGMKNSHFMTPDGWDNDNQYVTAADLVTLAKYALSVPEIRTITGTHEKYVEFVSGENITWTNTNYLLDPDSEYYCENAIGIKTGTTDNAGYCLLSAFQKNGKTYITAVLGCNANEDRYNLTLKLFNLI